MELKRTVDLREKSNDRKRVFVWLNCWALRNRKRSVRGWEIAEVKSDLATMASDGGNVKNEVTI